ncbi:MULTISPECIES: hypothetical protein [unclassified Clostridium]|uniref:hypothetical protein n=1 Tax=unclassified Clostridium TaxID=2614128 RepID=UPI0002979A3C|nr:MULTISPECIES: hypothetical protein [unclassified Clostridium]EKQ57055.1 MAG: hypothetical protein A370_01363 [Clostridium sp. Maddingley MBC34-26]
MGIRWWPLRGLDIQRNEKWEREIRIYDDFSKTMYYRINSITLFKEPYNLELHYTYYDKDKHELHLFRKNGTIIANTEQYLGDQDENIKNELYLLEFGKGLANHLELYFFNCKRQRIDA